MSTELFTIISENFSSDLNLAILVDLSNSQKTYGSIFHFDNPKAGKILLMGNGEYEKKILCTVP